MTSLISKILAGIFMLSWSTPHTEFRSTPEKLRGHVEFLAGLNPPRSYDQPASLQKAADYIFNEFSKAGLQPVKQTFKAGSCEFQNIVVRLGPAQGSVLVIGAHYDVAGHAPGADDNASGIAGLLELARLLAPVAKDLKRPVELVAYCLEEPPFFGGTEMGSYVHAQRLSERKEPVGLMISLEMIGYFSDQESSQTYPLAPLRWIYPSKGNFIAIVGRSQERAVLRKISSQFKKHSKVPLETLASPVDVPGLSLSDHSSYWKFDFPAVMVTDTAFMRNPHYHQKSDTPETLDYRRMSEVVNGIAGFARHF